MVEVYEALGVDTVDILVAGATYTVLADHADEAARAVLADKAAGAGPRPLSETDDLETAAGPEPAADPVPAAYPEPAADPAANPAPAVDGAIPLAPARIAREPSGSKGGSKGGSKSGAAPLVRRTSPSQ